MASRHPVAYPSASPDAIEFFREHGDLVVEDALEPGDLEELEAPAKRTVIKWEKGARDTVLGVEPAAHLHPLLEERAHDPRLPESDRRALLYSYQPAGHRHAREYIRIDPERGIEIGPPGGAAEPGA